MSTYLVKLDRVADGRVRLSPTQIDTWNACRRKGAFSRILRRPAGPGAQLGTEVHTAEEVWLLEGKIDTTTRVGRLAAAAIPYLPKPKSPGLEVETEASVETEHAVITGRIDAIHFWIAIDENGDEILVATVYDHKTTRDFRYAKSPEDLATDTQGAIYTMHAYRIGADRVELQWTYIHTERVDEVRPVRFSPSRTHYLPILQEIDELAVELETYDGKPIHELPPDARACESFGGCPYSAECGLTAHERMRSIMSNEDLKAKLKAKMLANAGATTTVPVGATAAPIVATPVVATPTPAAVAAPVQEAPPPPAAMEQPAAVASAAERMRRKNAIASTVAPDIAAKAQERAETRAAAPSTIAEAAASAADAPRAADGLPIDQITAKHLIAGLRDQFAGAALNGMLARGSYASPDEYATEAYAQADAMIAARIR